jgi:hypothetical protein
MWQVAAELRRYAIDFKIVSIPLACSCLGSFYYWRRRGFGALKNTALTMLAGLCLFAVISLAITIFGLSQMH